MGEGRQAGSARGLLPTFAILVLLLCACSPSGEHVSPDGEAPIPIAGTQREIVVVTSPMKADMTFSMVGLRRRDALDDGETRWTEQFEEQVEAPHEGFIRRRFRVTLANGSDQAREYAIEIDYVSDTSGEVVLHRTFRRIFVPPFTKKQVSGYTALREDRAVHADMRVREVTEGEDGE